MKVKELFSYSRRPPALARVGTMLGKKTVSPRVMLNVKCAVASGSTSSLASSEVRIRIVGWFVVAPIEL